MAWEFKKITPWTPIDYLLILFVESVYVRLQNLTGVPRYQMARTCWAVFAVWVTAHVLNENLLLGAFALVWLYFSLCQSHWRSSIRIQQTADERQMVMPNAHLPDIRSFAVRMLTIWLVATMFITSHLKFANIAALGFFVYLYLQNVNTHPRPRPLVLAEQKPQAG